MRDECLNKIINKINFQNTYVKSGRGYILGAYPFTNLGTHFPLMILCPITRVPNVGEVALLHCDTSV